MKRFWLLTMAVLLLGGCAGKNYRVIVSNSPGFQLTVAPTLGHSGSTTNTPDIKPALDLSGLAALLSTDGFDQDNVVKVASVQDEAKSWLDKIKAATKRLMESNLPANDKKFWSAVIQKELTEDPKTMNPTINISKSDVITSYAPFKGTRPGEGI